LKEPPPPGGVSFLGGSPWEGFLFRWFPSEEREVRGTPLENNGCFLGEVFFLKTLHLETTQKENLSGRGGVSFGQIAETQIYEGSLAEICNTVLYNNTR